MAQTIGILTAGGDTPGLNAAIRAVGKAAILQNDAHVVGFHDGFRGLIENRSVQLSSAELADILTRGGTILGTSRVKPHKTQMGNKVIDMTDVILENCNQHHLDALVCIGGGGTHKNAMRLVDKGIRVLTMPKTIDNDVTGTDTTIGFDTALGIATEAIDRLHSTAHSHHRIIVVEVMGHNAGWLALGSGLAGGADVILIPEVPYQVDVVAESIRKRSRSGKRFSIVAVSEGAMSREQAKSFHDAEQKLATARALPQDEKKKSNRKQSAKAKLADVEQQRKDNTLRLSRQLEEMTGLESRVTILGHVQRGGAPSSADRLLATRLGTACARLIDEGMSNVMVAAHGEETVPVPLAEVVGKRKVVPADHPWLQAARDIGVCMGDE
ncbi:MAG: 6-phosphofructokinase [Pirellulaceae bacterium]